MSTREKEKKTSFVCVPINNAFFSVFIFFLPTLWRTNLRSFNMYISVSRGATLVFRRPGALSLFIKCRFECDLIYFYCMLKWIPFASLCLRFFLFFAYISSRLGYRNFPRENRISARTNSFTSNHKTEYIIEKLFRRKGRINWRRFSLKMFVRSRRLSIVAYFRIVFFKPPLHLIVW